MEAVFYKIPGSEKCSVMTCKIIARAYREGFRVFINTNNTEETKTLDDLLWTFSDESFIPHSLANDATTAEAPNLLVQIGETNPPLESDIVIHFHEAAPHRFNQLKRLIEIVPVDNEAWSATAREHYKALKQAGITPQVHDLTKTSF